MTRFTKNHVAEAALEWFSELGYTVLHGPDISPDGSAPERDDYSQPVLKNRLRDALARLNLELPSEALDDAFRRLLHPEGSADLILRNRAVHRMLVDGVTVEYHDQDGAVRGAQVRVLDFDRPESNDWLVVNQFSVTENKRTRRPDVALVVSDGTQTRVGAHGAEWEWFKPWRSAVGEQLTDERLSEFQVVTRGLFHKQYLLGLIRDFIVQAHAEEALA